MLALIQYSAHRVGENYDVAEWLKLNHVSYYCNNDGSVELPGGSSSLIISGGPFTSQSVRYLGPLISEFRGPIFGICLGGMAVVEAFGGELENSNQSDDVITVDGDFPGFSGPAEVKAAHRQKIVRAGELKPCLFDVRTKEIVGVRHQTKPIFGVMFHPESPITTCGSDILWQFLRLAR